MREVKEEAQQILAARFGPENVKGGEELINTEWIDSCHSDSGNVSKEVMEMFRRKRGIPEGTQAWEVRKRLFVSPEVSKPG